MLNDLHASLHDFASYLLYHVVDCGSVGRGSHGSWVKLLMAQMGHGSSHVTHCLLCSTVEDLKNLGGFSQESEGW